MRFTAGGDDKVATAGRRAAEVPAAALLFREALMAEVRGVCVTAECVVVMDGDLMLELAHPVRGPSLSTSGNENCIPLYIRGKREGYSGRKSLREERWAAD